MPRRRQGALLPLEVDILDAALAARRDADGEVHGFDLARRIASGASARKLTSHGTLYKALGRLEEAGLLASRWEDPETAARQGRPRRRLYTVTGEGERRLAAWRHAQPARAPAQPGWQGGT